MVDEETKQIEMASLAYGILWHTLIYLQTDLGRAVFDARSGLLSALEKREQKDGIRNAGLALRAPVLKEALRRVDHTLSVHGHVDGDTELHKFIENALEEREPTLPSNVAAVAEDSAEADAVRGHFIERDEDREQALAEIRDIMARVSQCPHSADPNAGVIAIALVRQIEISAARARDCLSRPSPGPHLGRPPKFSRPPASGDLLADLVNALKAQVDSTSMLLRRAGFSDQDISDCTSQARRVLTGVATGGGMVMKP